MTKVKQNAGTAIAETEAVTSESPGEASVGMHNRELAIKGEACAAHYLEMKGYEIVARNWTCPVGEVDIVARTEDAIVFVEVKTRSNADRGFPEEAVTAKKRAKYEKLAAVFLQGFDAVEIAIRFDVIGILVLGPERAIIRHHVNAFGAA